MHAMLRSAACIGVVAAMLGGCRSCEVDKDLVDPPGEAMVELYVSVATMPELVEFMLNVQQVRAVVADVAEGPEREIDLGTPPATIDLLQFGFEVPLLAWVGSVPAAYLKQLRFITADDSVRLRQVGADGPTVIECDLKVPSGAETGVKIVGQRGPFELIPDRTTRILVELDPSSQLVLNQGQGCLFKPTLRAIAFERPALQDYLTASQSIVSVTVIPLPSLGLTLEIAKVYDNDTGRILVVAVDQNGNLVDANALRSQERQAYRARWGALTPEVRQALSELSDPVAEMMVHVVHRAESIPAFDATAGADDARRAAHAARLSSMVEGARSALLQRLSSLPDVSVLSMSSSAPFITLRAPVSVVREMLAFDPDIMAILNDASVGSALAESQSLDMAEEPLWDARGLTGRGVVVYYFGNCDLEGGKIDFADEAFSSMEGKQANLDCRPDTDSGHATCAAASVGMMSGHYAYGGAPRVSLYEIATVADDAIPPPAGWPYPHIVDQSKTSNVFTDAAMEWQAAKLRVLWTQAAGNDPSEPVGCRAYNALCVGGYNGSGSSWSPSLGQAAFADDTPMGSYKNDYSEREVPDLVGPWTTNHQSCSRGGWGGTSFSAPHVSGLSALLMEAHPEAKARPTLIKAVLMASAYHNVADFLVTRPNDPDGLDGAGVPRGDRALEILDAGNWIERTLTTSDFDADGFLIDAPSFTASQYDFVRVALVWEACPADIAVEHNYAHLSAELDLALDGAFGASGPPETTKVAASTIDNRQLLATIVTQDGEYRLRVHVSRLDPCLTATPQESVHMALAWAHVPLVEELPH